MKRLSGEHSKALELNLSKTMEEAKACAFGRCKRSKKGNNHGRGTLNTLGHAGFLSPRRAAARRGLPKMTIFVVRTLETSASSLWMRTGGVELCLRTGHSSTPVAQVGAGNAVRSTRRGKSVAQIAAVARRRQ
jgi:hypothetical protein